MGSTTIVEPTMKTVLITGCSSGGIGYALAEAFADVGYHVFATARDLSKAKDLTKHSSGNIQLLQLDVSSSESIKACVAAVDSATEGRGLDVLVNNAGGVHTMPLLDVDLDKARQTYEVNVWGVLALTQGFAGLLIKTGGVLMNIASIAAGVVMPWGGIYNSSKAAVANLSETLRLEMAPLGVRVITAMVGVVGTKIFLNTGNFALPPGSRYKSVEEQIAKQAQGEDLFGHMDIDTVAKRLVSDVVAGRSGKVWRGGLATATGYLSWLMPTWASDWMGNSRSGLYNVKKP
ncbi:hypothetical protein MCOR27_002145 [Pyricularia oryzae]|uniref:NADPH-dependent 1-acyldihydroxyacetone phosphate reductase n=2 Tax=Pyricularia TaxID=48558 RepID=A0ABQ8NAX3_PYRGI|nr:hypothetical protein MCOR01_000002 [Pyricularia oryzae]KAI6293575.1 hypothetical protein MCOR33_009030 [Pyricularia grisea]KAH9428297.1 hypothetical protein MCOR02_011782 [Pyricularia oryzae]KAI6271686.1 hypothetical protein MCOR26_007686 [Pyricularia oryzae]KAI6285858.1 hypothetical protein MCOR27_002145 [Pyricularia oryzae]